MVKHSYLVKNAAEVPRIIPEAFFLAQSGRPGPVLIDMPKDVSNTLIDPIAHDDFHLPGYKVPAQGDSRDIELAAALLQQARRPVLLIGHGAVLSGAEEEVRRLAEKLSIPVTNTLLGKGCFPETHELSVGMLGMHGTAYANLAVQHCDLIMSVGSRWDDRIVGKLEEFCTHARKIHVDIDPAEINKTVRIGGRGIDSGIRTESPFHFTRLGVIRVKLVCFYISNKESACGDDRSAGAPAVLEFPFR